MVRVGREVEMPARTLKRLFRSEVGDDSITLCGWLGTADIALGGVDNAARLASTLQIKYATAAKNGIYVRGGDDLVSALRREGHKDVQVFGLKIDRGGALLVLTAGGERVVGLSIVGGMPGSPHTPGVRER